MIRSRLAFAVTFGPYLVRNRLIARIGEYGPDMKPIRPHRTMPYLNVKEIFGVRTPGHLRESSAEEVSLNSMVAVIAPSDSMCEKQNVSRDSGYM